MTEGGDGTFGRSCSEETKQKISIANSGKTASEYTRKLLSEASKNTGQDRKTIANSANGKTKVTKSTKFIWKYKE